MIPLFIYPAIWSLEYNISGSLIVACEQTRFILKSRVLVETFKTKRYLERHGISKNDKIQIDDHEDEDDEKFTESTNFQWYRMSIETKKSFTKMDGMDNNNNPKPTWLVNVDLNLADMMVSFAFFVYSNVTL